MRAQFLATPAHGIQRHMRHMISPKIMQTRSAIKSSTNLRVLQRQLCLWCYFAFYSMRGSSRCEKKKLLRAEFLCNYGQITQFADAHVCATRIRISSYMVLEQQTSFIFPIS